MEDPTQVQARTMGSEGKVGTTRLFTIGFIHSKKKKKKKKSNHVRSQNLVLL